MQGFKLQYIDTRYMNQCGFLLLESIMLYKMEFCVVKCYLWFFEFWAFKVSESYTNWLMKAFCTLLIITMLNLHFSIIKNSLANNSYSKRNFCLVKCTFPCNKGSNVVFTNLMIILRHISFMSPHHRSEQTVFSPP